METERASPRFADIDLWDPADILDCMIEAQFAAVAAVRSVRPAIEQATRLGIQAACIPGIRRISAGNYGGSLGKYKFYLHKVLEGIDSE